MIRAAHMAKAIHLEEIARFAIDDETAHHEGLVVFDLADGGG